MLGLLAAGGLFWSRQRPPKEPEAQIEAAYALGDWHRTALLARERLKLAPDDPHALRLAARAAARLDQDPKAVAIYQRLDRTGNEAEDFFLLGRSLIRTGKLDQAFQAYESARGRDPDHPETLAALAGLYLRTDRFNAAAEAASRLAVQPAWEARAQLMLGTARAESQDYAGAAESLARWAALDPHGQVVSPAPVPPLRKLLARCLLQSGKPAEARSVIEAILHTDPDPEAWWLFSRCAIQERDWRHAAALLQEHPGFRADHPVEPEPAPYVGAARCAGCHRAEYDATLASRHATTFARAEDLQGLPLPRDPVRDPGNPAVTHRVLREGNSLIVETHHDQKVFRAVVDYAFGSLDHFTTMVGRDELGRPRMIRMSPYRSPRGEGWDIATGLPLQPADEEEYLGKKMFAGDGPRRCLNCHTTNVQAILRRTGPEAADHAIGCERCHGPGGHHLAAVEAEFVDPAIDRPGEAKPAEVDRVCARCHGIVQPESLALPRTDPIWLRFQSLTLTWSRCYDESDGMLGCVTCHDPHRNVETNAAWYEGKCLSCHAAPPRSQAAGLSPGVQALGKRAGEEQKARKAASCPVNPTRGCIECHLPRVWVQSTHSFKADHYIRIRERDRGEFPSRGPSDRLGHE
jgi:tetratricopeptide (TPR) repeat protein